MGLSKKSTYSFFLLFMCLSLSHAQGTVPFSREVKEIQMRLDSVWDASKETMVFTGSSSIRLWKDLQERFPQYQVLNTGFGGSQCWDLANFLHELILDYRPRKVFIYEGDNDISAKKKPREIIGIFNRILDVLQERSPQMEIVLISAKPSISRWRFRNKYRRLNRKLDHLASNRAKVFFADVWTVMLNEGKLKKDLFIEDGLHMNAKGYDLWYGVLKKFVTNDGL